VKRSRFTDAQVIGILKEQELGAKTADLCRMHGISSAAFDKSKYGGERKQNPAAPEGNKGFCGEAWSSPRPSGERRLRQEHQAQKTVGRCSTMRPIVAKNGATRHQARGRRTRKARMDERAGGEADQRFGRAKPADLRAAVTEVVRDRSRRTIRPCGNGCGPSERRRFGDRVILLRRESFAVNAFLTAEIRSPKGKMPIHRTVSVKSNPGFYRLGGLGSDTLAKRRCCA
jgi:Transposase